jgi:hypothetical protein
MAAAIVEVPPRPPRLPPKPSDRPPTFFPILQGLPTKSNQYIPERIAAGPSTGGAIAVMPCHKQRRACIVTETINRGTLHNDRINVTRIEHY